MKIQTMAPPARRTCVACELLLPAAGDGAPLCLLCAEDVGAARRRVETRLELARGAPRAAWLTLNRALDVLNEAEAARWERMRAALSAVLDGRADADTRARVRETARAIDRGKAPPALAAVWRAYEGNWWAGAEAAALAERATRQIETLDAWLAQEPQEAAA